VSQGLCGVRKVARERRQERFTCLLHHVSVDLLRDRFYALKRRAAPGVDGVIWHEYEIGLEDRLSSRPVVRLTSLRSAIRSIRPTVL
jgi:RNA-directed DNA polymerase